MGATGFELSKWYADCVADDGEVIIAYVARLVWRGLQLKYASLLHADASGRTSSKFAVVNIELPIVSPSEFRWQARGFGLQGRWLARQSEIQQTIYDSDEGSIRWNCLQPMAEATLTLDGRQVSGLGYVERLDMTLPPWKMPIDTLNWGRFLADRQSVVWIDWKGHHSVRHVWVNGAEKTATALDDNAIDIGDASLRLKKNATLREGVIGETVLHVIPKWLGPLPGRVLGIQETKWRSRGELTSAAGEVARGWAIHEVVEWPK